MKPNHPIENDLPLKKVLAQWKIESALPPGFQNQVWRRIEAAEARRPESVFAGFLRWIDLAFYRPRFALSYLTVLLFIGLGAGYWQAQDKTAHAEAKYRALYVQSVDPYRAPRN